MTTILRPNQGGNNIVSIISEDTWGVTPTGAYQQVPFTSFELNYSEAELLDDTISNDDLRIDTQGGSQSVGGTITANAVGKYHMKLMASAMKSTWVPVEGQADTYSIKSGATLNSFTVEVNATDKNLNCADAGVVVNTLGLSANSGFATKSFGVMGRTRTLGTTTGATSLVPFTTEPKSMRLAGGHVKVDGQKIKLTAFQMDTNSNYQPNYSADSDVVDHLSSDRSDKTGTITLWHDDNSFENMLSEGTEFEIDALIGDGVYTEQYIGRRAKVTAVNKSIAMLGSITKTVTYRLLKDSTGTDLEIIAKLKAGDTF